MDNIGIFFLCGT